MLDNDYINEFRALDTKESKNKLSEYAAQFGIKLKKTKSFDNMVKDLKDELEYLKNEPLPENNEGLSISDLIDAADELEGKRDYIVGDIPASDEAKQLLIDSPVLNDIKIEAHIEETHVTVKDKNDKLIKTEHTVNESHFNDEDKKIIEDKLKICKLPKNFNPTLVMLGKNPGYVTLPWWIYQWIKETPNWKSNPKSFNHPTAHDTLLSLIYYIKRDGSIKVRETRNSSFDILK